MEGEPQQHRRLRMLSSIACIACMDADAAWSKPACLVLSRGLVERSQQRCLDARIKLLRRGVLCKCCRHADSQAGKDAQLCQQLSPAQAAALLGRFCKG